MVSFDWLLGVVSPATEAAVLREGRRLRSAGGGALYVAPIRDRPPSEPEQIFREHRGRAGGQEGAGGLVMVGRPPEADWEAPMEDPLLRALLRDGSDSVFVLHATTTPDTVQRILVPTDFSAASARGVRVAVGLAQVYEAEVVVLHVVEGNPYVALTPRDRLSIGPVGLPEHRARRQLKKWIQAQERMEVPIEARVRGGTTAEQVGQALRAEAVDLLVLPAGGAGQDRLGAVADRVLRRETGPLVLVRSGDAE
jgi:nucleotide-binding universal stress UspA family protein